MKRKKHTPEEIVGRIAPCRSAGGQRRTGVTYPDGRTLNYEYGAKAVPMTFSTGCNRCTMVT
jgi:hypothetical protein